MLHSPYTADRIAGSGHGDLVEELREKTERAEKLRSDRIKARAETVRLYELIRDNPNSPQLDRWKKQLEEARKIVEKLDGQIHSLDNEISRLEKRLKNDVWRGFKRPVPRHYSDEKYFETWGFSYVYITQSVFELIPDIINGNWQRFLAQLSNPTRLYHLGGRDPDWYFPDGHPKMSDGHDIFRPKDLEEGWLGLKGTMTVPRGRTLRIRHPLQLRGDLWLQKGSTLHIEGSLELQTVGLWNESDGTKIDSGDVAYPDGKLIIEEGAVLRVDGDLKCEGGSATHGSIMVAGPMDRVHPISSAIFCSGDFSTKYGIHTAVGLEDLFAYAARDNKAFVPARDTLFHLSHLVPMASRILGPFDRRKCWFADSATTISIFIIKGIPVPVPTPMPQLGNCMRTLFDGLSWIATVQLNLRLGPYFYPQASLWVLGRGMTPVLLKTDPKILDPILNPLQRLPVLDPRSLLPVVEQAIRDIAVGAAKKLFFTLAGKILTAILKSKIPYTPVTCGLFGDNKPPPALEKFAREMLGLLRGVMLSSVKKMLSEARSVARRHYIGNPSMLSRELSGLLVYSDGKMTIGTLPSESVLASGLFIADDDLTFRTRRVMGTAVSLDGNVYAEEFLYYPFFSSASLYRSLKPSEYGRKSSAPESANIDMEMRDALFLGIPVNNGPAINIDLPGSRAIYQGWVK